MPGQPQLRVPRLDFQLEGLSHGEKSCRVRKNQRALLTTSPSAPHAGCTCTQTLTHTHTCVCTCPCALSHAHFFLDHDHGHWSVFQVDSFSLWLRLLFPHGHLPVTVAVTLLCPQGTVWAAGGGRGLPSLAGRPSEGCYPAGEEWLSSRNWGVKFGDWS